MFAIICVCYYIHTYVYMNISREERDQGAVGVKGDLLGSACEHLLSGLRFRCLSFGFRVSGFEFRISGFG